MSLTIELPEHLEQQLQEAAAERGQPVSDYVREALEAHLGAADSGAHPLAELFASAWEQILRDERAKLPSDLAEQHDHYIYGTPKH